MALNYSSFDSNVPGGNTTNSELVGKYPGKHATCVSKIIDS